MEHYSLVLAFPNGSEDFVHGFEAGRVWSTLQTTPDTEEVTATVHIQNAEVLIRMAEATKRSVKAEDLNEDWINIIFGVVENEQQP